MTISSNTTGTICYLLNSLYVALEFSFEFVIIIFINKKSLSYDVNQSKTKPKVFFWLHKKKKKHVRNVSLFMTECFYRLFWIRTSFRFGGKKEERRCTVNFTCSCRSAVFGISVCRCVLTLLDSVAYHFIVLHAVLCVGELKHCVNLSLQVRTERLT